ncbi:hypothetical protein [Lacticaseibacillus sp. GG6-2]
MSTTAEATADATMVKKANEALNSQGFVDEHQLPELENMFFARDLTQKVIKEREKNSEEGYIYTEPFDFSGGRISNIVWNMDKIKSREDAEQTLADDMHWSVVKPSLSAADQKEF